MGKVTGFMEYERVEEGHKPIPERVKHYKEFVIGLSDEQAIYRGIQSRWDNAAAQVRDILDQIRTTLGQTTESVETMRARVSQSLQG